MKIEKFSQFKHKTILSKLIPYDFSLLSIILFGYLLIDAITHYILKYLFSNIELQLINKFLYYGF